MDTFRRPKLIIAHTVEEGAEIKSKSLHNISNEIMAKNFPNLEKNTHPNKVLTKMMYRENANSQTEAKMST